MATDLLARGLAAKTWARARAESISVEECGAQPSGDARPAIQRAIDLAVANRIPRVVARSPRFELWEPALDDANGSSLAWFYRNRTLRLPACDALTLDFGGAVLTLKDPGGGARFPGQACPGAPEGRWLGGGITVVGAIAALRIARLTLAGGYAGDALAGAGVNVFDKGFACQDIVGMGRVTMDDVAIHGFAGELMYDNSAADHVSRDCRFHTSPQSCWNPNGLGRVTAINLEASNSQQVAEVVGGKGHSYFGGRFHACGPGGATFIGGPDPVFGASYNDPLRRSDAPPPYVHFHGTRFEDFANYLFLGSYMRGSIHCTDAAVFLAPGFASAGTLRDVDLDVTACADRQSAYAGVTVGGPVGDDASMPSNVHVRVHCSRTQLARDAGRILGAGLAVNERLDAANCAFTVDGQAQTAFGGIVTNPAGWTLPPIDTAGFAGWGADYHYFTADFTWQVRSRAVTLRPQASGSFQATVDAVPRYSSGQRFRFIHGGEGGGASAIRFPRSGAGMKLNAARTLRRGGDFLELIWSSEANAWVEAGFSGEAGPQTIPLLAAALTPNATAGPAPGVIETATHKVTFATLDFDGAAEESAQIVVPMPRSWDRGALSAQFVWTAGSIGSVVWGCQGLALSDDDPADAAFGEAATVADAVTATDDVMESAWTPDIVVSGSPVADDLVALRFFRAATAAADTLAGDARLIAVRLRYGAESGNDA